MLREGERKKEKQSQLVQQSGAERTISISTDNLAMQSVCLSVSVCLALRLEQTEHTFGKKKKKKGRTGNS